MIQNVYAAKIIPLLRTNMAKKNIAFMIFIPFSEVSALFILFTAVTPNFKFVFDFNFSESQSEFQWLVK